MEVCGGQTHSIVKHGIDCLLPEGIELVHGPGCPVCVTPLETIDKAHAIAARPDVIFCSFGDMLRVPGSRWRSVHIKVAGRRHSRRLLAARLPEDRARQSRQEGRVLRHRLRDHRSGQRDARLSREAGRREERFDSGVARAGAAVDHVHPAIAAESRAGIPWARARVRHHGLPRVRADRRALQSADRHHRLRAARPAARHADGRAPTRSRHAPWWKTSTRASSTARATCPRASWSTACSKFPTASGAASDRFRRAATSCAGNIATTMPNASSK